MEYAAVWKGLESDADRAAFSLLLGRLRHVAMAEGRGPSENPLFRGIRNRRGGSSRNFVRLPGAFDRYIRIVHSRHMYPITPGILCLVEELIRLLKGPLKLKSLGDR